MSEHLKIYTDYLVKEATKTHSIIASSLNTALNEAEFFIDVYNKFLAAFPENTYFEFCPPKPPHIILIQSYLGYTEIDLDKRISQIDSEYFKIVKEKSMYIVFENLPIGSHRESMKIIVEVR